MKSILFYSFKGGVGRTQTMINVAKYLSQEKKKKIAIVDFDIYAPGISYLAKFDADKTNNKYLLSYLLNLFKKEPTGLYCEEYQKDLFIIPSSQVNDNLTEYHNNLTELSKYLYSLKTSVDERNTNTLTLADALFKYIMNSIEALDLEFDYVFFDSRTGITEVSDILFSNLVDLKVFVSSFNNQNIKGTNEILKILANQIGNKHKVLRVLSPKPISSDSSKFKEIESKANLENILSLKEKFDWHGVFNVSYDTRIVSNDENVWEEFTDECKYRKEIISIANHFEVIFSNNDEMNSILNKV